MKDQNPETGAVSAPFHRRWTYAVHFCGHLTANRSGMSTPSESCHNLDPGRPAHQVSFPGISQDVLEIDAQRDRSCERPLQSHVQISSSSPDCPPAVIVH